MTIAKTECQIVYKKELTINSSIIMLLIFIYIELYLFID